jgi:amino acid transporter
MTPEQKPATVTATPTSSGESAPHLRRVLGLWDLVFYGLILLQPVSIASSFGLASKMSLGHAATTILIALAAIKFTAVSYGRMAALYPAAGSAYTYVGRGLNPYVGFLAGWAMFLDYVIIPTASVVFAALSLQRLLNDWSPDLSRQFISALGLHADPQHAVYVMLLILITTGITGLNLRGIRWTVGTNRILMAVMCVMVVMFVVQAIRFLWSTQGWTGLFSMEPLYNPRTFRLGTVCTATSFAVMTYIGFDGTTTLAEDTKDPKRTVPLALVLSCVIIGGLAAFQAYLAQRVWPDYTSFKDADTAFFDVCALVGGKLLFDAISTITAVAMIGSAFTGQVGAARILFAMGRDQAIPHMFARLDKRNNPGLNILLLGILTLVGTFLLNWEIGVTVSNFGAFLGFILVNLAVIRQFCFHAPPGHIRSWFADMLFPGLGFLFCGIILVSLPTRAQIVGGLWFAAGLCYTAVQTRGFREPPAQVDLSGS